MTGTRVLAILVVSVLATAVVPPAFAWVVNHRRVVRAEADVAAIAGGLRNPDPELRRLATAVDVLCGPGPMPHADAAVGPWTTAPRGALAAAFRDRLPLSADPWGNCYVVNLAAMAAGDSTTVWVLSAGPNGIIETPFLARDAAAPAGNDVGMRIR